MTLFHLIEWRTDFSFTIIPLRLKPLCCLRKQLSTTAYEVRTTSYFFSSLMLDSLDAPCHTSVLSMLSVCSSISFLHCMIATVGLYNDVRWACAKLSGRDARYHEVGLRAVVGDHKGDHLNSLAHTKAHVNKRRQRTDRK